MKRPFILAFAIIILLTACGPAATPTPVPEALFVDPGTDLGPISPYLFGTNYGPMHAVVVDKMPLVESAGFTALRFPAGAWTDVMDIQPFQIDAFIAFCKQVGAIPTISVRLLNGSPKVAAELVRYTNIEKKYGVVYWSIGNEPNLYTELHQADYDYTTEDLNKDWRPIAEAMKAVDPSIRLMGPELAGWEKDLASTPKDSAGRDWMAEFLKANGDLVSVVTVHRYPMYAPAGQAITVQDLRENTRDWTTQVDYLRTLTKQVTGRDIPIAYTEINSDPSRVSDQIASPDSFYNAVWYADVLGQLMNSHVFMVNQWVLSQRDTGLGLLHGDDVRPTFYVFPMYKNFGSKQVYAASGVADVDVFAAKRKDGALTVMVINLSDGEQRVPLRIKGPAFSQADVWLLDVDHDAENLGLQPFPADGTLILPAQSATLFVFKK
ncbi:MAG TPA: glycoside hydrolase family 44 protein [Anaerolineales bacterium]|nr:glycoside hydrolase family 44 protein [Anaerolineales bacterium]